MQKREEGLKGGRKVEEVRRWTAAPAASLMREEFEREAKHQQRILPETASAAGGRWEPRKRAVATSCCRRAKGGRRLWGRPGAIVRECLRTEIQALPN